jgi:hypothetical protein
MSSWCRECPRYLATLVLLALGASAKAAEVYFQPQAEVGIEEDSNRNLVTSGDLVAKKESSEGYSAEASGTWGIATPTSDFTIRPEVSYSDYPRLSTNALRTLLDLNSQFHSDRGQASLEGRFDRQATYSSELANPQFNPVTPDLPTTPETGRISSDTTRTLITAVSSYTYDLTQRLNWGVTGTVQSVDYSGSNAANYISYNYYLGGTSLTWGVTSRLAATLGVFSSRESAKDDNGSVNADGATLAFSYKLSTQWTNRLEFTGERDDTDVVKPFALKSTSTGAGATYTAAWQGQISKLQLSAGRTFTPSGGGGIFRADQLQVQYDRDLTQRLAFTGAARVINDTSVSGAYTGSNYDYVNVTTRLKWKLTPTWYVAGGAEYLRAHFEPPVGAASNVMLYASVGYLGLGKPQ